MSIGLGNAGLEKQHRSRMTRNVQKTLRNHCWVEGFKSTVAWSNWLSLSPPIRMGLVEQENCKKSKEIHIQSPSNTNYWWRQSLHIPNENGMSEANLGEWTREKSCFHGLQILQTCSQLAHSLANTLVGRCQLMCRCEAESSLAMSRRRPSSSGRNPTSSVRTSQSDRLNTCAEWTQLGQATLSGRSLLWRARLQASRGAQAGSNIIWVWHLASYLPCHLLALLASSLLL